MRNQDELLGVEVGEMPPWAFTTERSMPLWALMMDRIKAPGDDWGVWPRFSGLNTAVGVAGFARYAIGI